MEDQENQPEAQAQDEATPVPRPEAEADLLSPTNKYEIVMVAAKEAERLNLLYRNRHEKPPQKVTTMAIERVIPGLTKFTYEEAEPEDTGEQLPFFNPEI